MSGALVVVTGTGTEIGKTHLSEVLLRHWANAGRRVVGLKPVESGVTPGASTDAARLASASSFHVKPFGYALPDPISPHLAARRAGTTIDLRVVADGVRSVAPSCDLTLVELPGGLFSPLSDEQLNADLARMLDPDVTLLCAPDRLGVLHDVVAAVRAAESFALPLTGVILLAPAAPDPSTGTNARELRHFVRVPILGTLPRAPVEDLIRRPDVIDLLAHVTV